MRLENVKTWPALKASRMGRFLFGTILAFGMNRLTISSNWEFDCWCFKVTSKSMIVLACHASHCASLACSQHTEVTN